MNFVRKSRFLHENAVFRAQFIRKSRFLTAAHPKKPFFEWNSFEKANLLILLIRKGRFRHLVPAKKPFPARETCKKAVFQALQPKKPVFVACPNERSCPHECREANQKFKLGKGVVFGALVAETS